MNLGVNTLYLRPASAAFPSFPVHQFKGFQRNKPVEIRMGNKFIQFRAPHSLLYQIIQCVHRGSFVCIVSVSYDTAYHSPPAVLLLSCIYIVRRLRNARTRINTGFFLLKNKISPQGLWYNRIAQKPSTTHLKGDIYI